MQREPTSYDSHFLAEKVAVVVLQDEEGGGCPLMSQELKSTSANAEEAHPFSLHAPIVTASTTYASGNCIIVGIQMLPKRQAKAFVQGQGI